MKTITNYKWASVALLSIIVPISLLATFRLTGVLKEPQTPETITVEPISWNMSRLSRTTIIDMWVRNYYKDNITWVNLRVHVADYSENSEDFPSWGNDYVKLWIIAEMNITNGFIYSAIIKFSRTDTDAILGIFDDPSSIQLQNVQIRNYQPATDKHEGYFEAYSFNQPKNSLLGITTAWIFLDENNANHEITITLEGTYFDGVVYRKTIVPIYLGVLVS